MNKNMEIKSTNLIMLTGAGFTKNFDGFLGNEMWAKVFNNTLIQSNNKLRDLLQDDYDFESVYGEVEVSKELSTEDKKMFQNAVESAYKFLDDAVRSWEFNESNPTALDVYKLFGQGGFMSSLNMSGQEEGFFFTLNQDLFLERRLGYRAVGANFFPQEFYQSGGKREFKDSYFVQLPKELDRIEKSIKNHSGIHYVKLHGSYGWKSSDGTNQMALGKNKWENLKKEPLLKAFFELFNRIIQEGNKKILIIGYGFRDQHVNKILLEGVQKYNLKIYIITTMSPQDFDNNLNNGHVYALPIKKGISGYFPYRLAEIFPRNQAGSVHLEEIKKALAN